MSSPFVDKESIFLKLMTGPLVELSPRWIRVKFAGETIANSKRALLFRQYGPDRLPSYYFPREDISADLRNQHIITDPNGEKTCWSLQSSDGLQNDVAWAYSNPITELEALKNYITFDWNKMESWFEEDEEVFVHARDPYKRVDVLPSRRHIKVVVDDVVVADTNSAHLLFETSLPTRYYIPKQDVRMDLLSPSELTTRCPYKGIANYLSVQLPNQIHEDIVWTYAAPIPECPKLRDLLCFYNEKVNIYEDDELIPRPQTKWS